MSRSPETNIHVVWTPGLVQAINIVTGERAQAASLPDMRSLWNGNRRALVGVGRSVVFLKALRLPKAAPNDLRRILSIQLGQLFPLPANQLSFDFLQTEDRNAEGYLTIVGAMRSEDLRLLRDELQAAGVAADRILPISLAAPIAAQSAGSKDALVVANDVAGLGLDVVQGGTVRFSRVVPAGSDPEVEAQRTMSAAQAGSLPVVTAGHVPQVEGRSSRADVLTLLSEAPPFAFELAEDLERAVKQKIAARTRLAVLMVVSALLLLVLVLTDRHNAALQVQASKAQGVRKLKKLDDAQSAAATAAANASAVLATLQSAYHTAQPMSDIVSVVADSLPKGAWLTGVTVERGKPLQIRGTAKSSDDVAQFVNALGGNPRFRNVRLVFASTGTIANIPIVQFNVTATCVGNLPMPAPPKPGSTTHKTTTTQTTGAAQ